MKIVTVNYFIQIRIIKFENNKNNTAGMFINNCEHVFGLARKIPVRLFKDPAVAYGFGFSDKILQAI